MARKKNLSHTLSQVIKGNIRTDVRAELQQLWTERKQRSVAVEIEKMFRSKSSQFIKTVELSKAFGTIDS